MSDNRSGIRVHRPDDPPRAPLFHDRPARPATTWKSVAVLAIVVFGVVGMAWACAWGVRG